jgi:pSer/pThr/pTyr-binding forkhead associated (FHA) protein
MMKAKLYCKTGLLAGAKYEFSRSVSIGRSGANAIVLDPPLISDVHARIFFDAEKGCYFLEDAGSRNGTFLDGMRVTRPERLGTLHVITLAQKFDFIFQVLEAKPAGAVVPKPQAVPVAEPSASRNGNQAPAAEATPAAQVPAPPPAEFVRDPAEEKRISGGPVWKASPIRGKKNENPRPAPRRPTVVRKPTNGKTLIEDLLKQAPRASKVAPERDQAATMVEAIANNRGRDVRTTVLCLEAGSNGSKQVFALKEGENVLGRSPLCQICIDDPSISRKHAVLHVSSGKVWVKDLGSRNHTFVQGSTVAAEMEVAPETTLRFGTVEARVVSGDQ